MKKLTHDLFVEKLREKRGGEYSVLTEYTDTKTKISVEHSCGYRYDVTPNHLLGGRKCPSCGGGGIRKKNTSVFASQVEAAAGKSYTVLGSYSGVKEKILMRHEDGCGNEFDMRPGDFLKGQRCPKCSRVRAAVKRTKTTQEFISDVERLGGGDYKLASEYSNNKTYVTIRHEGCGREYEVLPVNFLKGHRCPSCAFSSSDGEKDLLSFIRSIYSGKVVENEKSLLDGKREIDIYLPESGVAFEYDGLYWHSESQGKGRNYHIGKTDEMAAKGIRLVHVFEDEWSFKRGIVESKVRNLLGLSSNRRVSARKCTVREIDSNVKDQFLEANHIQGKDISLIRLGLFLRDEIVSVMTFSRVRPSLGRSSSEKDYELVRFASRIDLSVVGAFSKMLKHFTRNYSFSTITTYADLRWSQESNVYEKSGFTLKHRSEPSYWYFKPGELVRYHRYSFRKSALKDKFPEHYSETETESQIMSKLKYEKVWDCGNLVYEMNKKD